MTKSLSVFAVIAGLMVSTSFGATWRAVQDGAGITWARIKIVNNSSEPSGWVISNCRTAIAATADTAETDHYRDWEGLVAAGETVYVWVYGYLQGEVKIDTADGGASAFNAGIEPAVDGDGELVITVASDRVVDAALETVADYGLPAQTGDLPEPPEVE